MVWQDCYFGLQNIIFFAITIPILLDVRSGKDINIWSALLYAIVQSTSTFVSLTMGYYLMALPFNAILWIAILYYRCRNGSQEIPSPLLKEPVRF